MPNLILRQVERDAGVRLTHVPYRNLGQMALDLEAGTLALAISTWTTLRRPGLKRLAVVAEQRVPGLEDVPTLAELGFRVASRAFGGIWAPRGLPAPLRARIEAACLAAAAGAGYQAFNMRSGQLAEPLGSEPFTRRIAEAEPVLAGLVRSLGIGAR